MLLGRKTIFVTGACGFIGTHLCEALLKRGDLVVGLDNFDDYYDPAIKRRNQSILKQYPGFQLHEGDLREPGRVEKILDQTAFDVVVHLAARAGVRPSIKNPLLYYDVNINATVRLLEAMKNRGLKKLVFASSSSVYGNSQNIPFSEDHRVDAPVSPYAATKKAGEELCYTYHHLYDFDVYALRFFTVYGPRQRPEMAISLFARKIATQTPVLFYGDGTTRRDYTHISDILAGVVKAIDRVRGFEICNIGGSATISLGDLVTEIEGIVGKKAILDRQPFQPGEVFQTYADTTRARSLLDYSPQMKIQDGLRDYWNWLKDHPEELDRP